MKLVTNSTVIQQFDNCYTFFSHLFIYDNGNYFHRSGQTCFNSG